MSINKDLIIEIQQSHIHKLENHIRRIDSLLEDENLTKGETFDKLCVINQKFLKEGISKSSELGKNIILQEWDAVNQKFVIRSVDKWDE